MSKKPVDDEDDEKPTPRPAHPSHERPKKDHPGGPSPDHELPTTPAPTTAARDDKGLIDPGDLPKPGEEVGLVAFQNAAGGDNGRAIYHAPPALRERVLTWRYQQHEQNHQDDDGRWVYRMTHTSGVGALMHDADLEPLESDAPVVDPRPRA